MAHPDSDEALTREWQAIAETLLENLPVDAALLRRAQGGSLEVVASAPDGEAFAAIAVKNRRNALANPMAQKPMSLTIDDVMASAPIAEPYKLLDCSTAGALAWDNFTVDIITDLFAVVRTSS